MNTEIAGGSKCYIALINDKPCGFIAITHFPHPKCAKFKRVHRLVVLPDYQGIGVGLRLLNFIANLYEQSKWRPIITTNNPALIYSLKKQQNWKCKFIGRQNHNDTSMFKKKNSSNKIVTSWEYFTK